MAITPTIRRAAMLATLLLPGSVRSQTTQMSVAVEVDEICAFEQSRYYLRFGLYDPENAHLATPLDAQTTIRVRCVGGLTAWVLLFPGNYPAVGSTLASPLRQLTDYKGSYLRYDLYQDAARTIPWGATTLTAPSMLGEAGVFQSFVVYGRMPPGQSRPVGPYADRVIVNYTM